MSSIPCCKFYPFYRAGRPPSRADRFAGGTIPVRAAQYCQAVTAASAFGWWLFPPIDTYLLWDGRTIVWSLDGQEWQAVDDSVHFPGFPNEFDAEVPDYLSGMAPPFLTSLPEPGLVQVSLGLFARTAPGWSMLIRRPSNFPLPGHIEHFEGLVDTSRWFGPLFINIRLTKTDTPIRLRADMPLAQAQPLPHSLLKPQMLAHETINSLGPDEWQAYWATTAEPNLRPDRAFGAYAADQRRCGRGGSQTTFAS
jgi:Family of unknown function (DUF6065)